MKKIIMTIAVMVFAVIGLQAQTPFDKFYEKYAGKDGYTSVNISKEMFQMFQSMADQEDKAEAKEMKEMIDQLNGLKLIVLKTDSLSRSKAASFYSEAAALFPPATYKEIMTVNESGNDMKFLTKQAGAGKISEMVMLMRGEDETMVLSLTGLIDIATVSKLSKTVNVPGMDKLKEVDGKK